MPVFNADILTRDPIRGGAVNAAGLTSLQGINPAQIAAKKAAEEAAKAGAAKFGLGTLLQGLGPAYGFYSVLDALGFFDGSGLEETPMTPEERAKFEAESRLALASSGLAEGGEGAYETLIDAVTQAAQTGLLSKEDIGVAGTWYDPETGEELPDFDPKTGKGMGTLFPIFEPSPVQTEAGGGGGGGDTAASSEAASAASSQTDTGIAGTDEDDFGNVEIVGRQLYEAIGAEKDPALKDALIREYESYTGQKYDPTSDPTASKATDQKIYGTTTDTTATTSSGVDDTSLNLPTVLYLPDFGGTSTTGTLTLPTSKTGTGTTGTGTTGTGTTGTGTTGTGTTGTGTTGTGTTGTGTTNIGGTGGGLSTGTGTGDGAGEGTGTGTGTGSGDGAGDGSGTGDGTGEGAGAGEGEAGAEEAANLINQGMRGVATEKAGVADIAALYDPSLSLAENMARMLGKKKSEQADAVDSALMYGGGIVQPIDLNDEILRILEGR